jgi:photosystem II stability/assembly factor-like uncharacterized protein
MKILQKLFIIISIMSTVYFVDCQKSKDPLSIPLAVDGNWRLTHYPQDQEYYSSFYFSDQNNGWVVGNNGKILHTENGGNSWKFQNSGTQNDLRSVYFCNSKIGWAVGRNNIAINTVDGGLNWRKVNINQDTIKSFYEITFTDKNNGWLISNRGELFHTTDEGKSWNLQLKWESGAGFLRFIDNNYGIIKPFIGNQIFVTTDGGKNWISKQNNTSMDWEEDICFIDKNNGWLCNSRMLSSFWEDSSSVYSTNNGGEKWGKLSTLPDRHLEAIYFLDSPNGWVAGFRIYYTNDGGYSWICQTPNISAFFKDVYFYDSSNGWALDKGGEIYKYIPKY